MPQMAPMNWMILYFFFILTFLIMNFFNYFYLSMNLKFKSFLKKKNTFNWKW
nr:ATP synthase F0 subunit 8 [Noterus clavicornis]